MGASFVYMTGNVLIALFAWLPLYVLRPNLRREMLLMSFLAAPLGLVTLFFFTTDYWVPQYLLGPWVPLEELMFSFLIAGVGGVSYEACFGKQNVRLAFKNKRFWALSFFVAGIAGMSLAHALGVNSIYASITLLILFSASLILLRHDFFLPALFSATVTALLMLVVYAVLSLLFPQLGLMWMHVGLSGATLFSGVPLEEFIWAAAWGLFAAPAFELVAGSRYIR